VPSGPPGSLERPLHLLAATASRRGRSRQGVPAMANYQVRGCCCGVPFGCGTVILAVLGWCLWEVAGVPALLAFLR
jgi:hypothetical protein